MKLLKERKNKNTATTQSVAELGLALGSREVMGEDGCWWEPHHRPLLGGDLGTRKRCPSCVIFNSRDRGFLPGCPVATGQCSRQKSHPKVKRVPLERSSLFQYFSSTIPRAVPKGVQEVKDPRHSTQFFPMETTHSIVVPPPKPFSSWTT